MKSGISQTSTASSPKRDLLAVFAHHRVAANLLMIIVIMMGAWSLQKLNIQFFPNFDLDIVNVRTVWSGASAEDVEQSLTKPLEQELYTLDNLHRISSTSATGISAITLEFDKNSDIGIALDEVNQRIARFRQLPGDAEEPEVSRVVRYENIARLLISQDNNLNNLRTISYEIRDQLLAAGIAKIDITGLPEEEISIEISNRMLQSLNKPLDQIAKDIRNTSQDIPAGFIGQSDVARQLRGLEQQRSVEAFQQLVIPQGDHQIRLGDISHIEKRARDNQVTLFHEGKPAVELLLRRTETSDSLISARILEQWLASEAKKLPSNLNLHVFDQSWKLIEDRISVLLINGLGGLILVIGILFIFLNGRAAFWVTAGIPVSFMATLILMYLAGSSINMISLFGLIMAVGIIVDDAIVVSEHALTRFNAGDTADQAAEIGARRMLAPVVSSSLTTIAAFLPMMMIGGIMGKIMFEIPLVIVCIVFASLFECILILPAHMKHALISGQKTVPSKIRQRLDDGFAHFQEKIFLPLVNKAIRYRSITLASAIGLLILAISLVAGGRIAYTFFPSTESQIIYTNVSFTAGTPKEKVSQYLETLTENLEEANQHFGGGNVLTAVIRQGITSSGGGTGTRSGDQYGSLFVELLSPDQRDFRNAEFIKYWKSLIQLPAGIELFNIAQRRGGPPGQDLDIRLTGNTPGVLKQASQELQLKLKSFTGVSAIEDDLPWGQEQMIYQLTPSAKAIGLNITEVGQQLRAAFDGILVQIFQVQNDELEVTLTLPKAERDKISDLNNFHIHLPDGQFAPLPSIVNLKSRKGFDALRHSQTLLTIGVTADVDRAQNNANRILNELAEDYLPQLAQKYSLQYFYEGQASRQKDTMADMKTGGLIALALIYIILAWVFSSYFKPLVVMSAIPFGITGALLGHYFMGIELTILSLFGIIGLSGIVVNDAIILITVYQELRKNGEKISTAIAQAATSRLRAVILTSLTTIAGLTPLLFETSVQAQFLIPMAVSITFGLAFATLLVLLFIPVILSYQESVYQFTVHKTRYFQPIEDK